ncbi:hypothetical protein [Glaciimonas sp. PAMC28666]|uniref:hypothetical protein n=1 Tax=Glaciimonas sp. PAMC28666 TaxID=2807626 RepID=UPI0019629F71|nr:hypothetical protein [Glaciimonas sp. PAMC28666]QRX82223.1 hypothetical protein JQN73_19355 [Glaciimonas sp. PAMC28666]
MLLTNVTMTVGEKLFEFSSVDNWLETVRDKFSKHKVNRDRVTCVSASGHVCTTAQELYAADFPVKVYHNP